MSLETLMKDNKNGLEPAVARDLFRQLLIAVTTLHSFKICHRDLKPDNIMLRPDPGTESGYYLTLIDFNVSVDMTTNPVIIGATGIKTWSAPETRTSTTGYDEKSDIYSLGRLLMHMLTGKKPDSEKAL
jgi:serine/threonine protein kinase